MKKRVLITVDATKTVATLKEKYGELMFHQSGGCCDGSQPMCFEKGDFIVGSSDVLIGCIDDCNFYMNKDQFAYWQYSELTIDVVEGRGSSFSLEIPLGVRFMVYSRLFTEAELNNLEQVIYLE